MSETKRCHECGETKSLADDFRTNPHGSDGYNSKCTDCCDYTSRGPGRSYIDKDASETAPPMTADRIMDAANLHLRERHVVEAAARAVERYREWYARTLGSGGAYDGESAYDLVSRLLPDTAYRRQARVLDAACALAQENGVRIGDRTTSDECPGCGGQKRSIAERCLSCWREEQVA